MAPDFNNKTISTLAKRAAYLCSNPDCRTQTVGPNEDPNKSTVIGEAAHIYGARPRSKRYVSIMTDVARANITNGVWLCRNCHKLIDTDYQKFSSDILFAWREEHEKYISSELGNATDKIRQEQLSSQLSEFKNYPPLVRRIIIDKPIGWEYKLTVELMRYLNDPILRKIEDLKDGLYIKFQEHIDEEEMTDWISQRMKESGKLVPPMVGLIDKLNKSWGAPGEEGDLKEIHHICCLIRDNLELIVSHEEKIYSTNVPERYERILELLKNLLGSQAEKLKKIPNRLEEIISYIDNDDKKVLKDLEGKEEMVVFEVPENWEKNFNKELKKLNISIGNPATESGCFSFLLLGIVSGSLIFFL
ncbi:hypothetical protein [Aquimarina algiphila]|uniref:HNH endonuclease n=1 Tax=Aquimarina algiphila TaxID=2047982 RepID=A0A554VHG5_9FLAO|nr:hypothetical protein [Aquimarina algiphila]TSE06973.1 hypothetical protein FOF46_17265 [Aquimarina algiphila]